MKVAIEKPGLWNIFTIVWMRWEMAIRDANYRFTSIEGLIQGGAYREELYEDDIDDEYD